VKGKGVPAYGSVPYRPLHPRATRSSSPAETGGWILEATEWVLRGTSEACDIQKILEVALASLRAGPNARLVFPTIAATQPTSRTSAHSLDIEARAPRVYRLLGSGGLRVQNIRLAAAAVPVVYAFPLPPWPHPDARPPARRVVPLTALMLLVVPLPPV
jgi:hypothetical protein